MCVDLSSTCFDRLRCYVDLLRPATFDVPSTCLGTASTVPRLASSDRLRCASSMFRLLPRLAFRPTSMCVDLPRLAFDRLRCASTCLDLLRPTSMCVDLLARLCFDRLRCALDLPRLASTDFDVRRTCLDLLRYRLRCVSTCLDLLRRCLDLPSTCLDLLRPTSMCVDMLSTCFDRLRCSVDLPRLALRPTSGNASTSPRPLLRPTSSMCVDLPRLASTDFDVRRTCLDLLRPTSMCRVGLASTCFDRLRRVSAPCAVIFVHTRTAPRTRSPCTGSPCTRLHGPAPRKYIARASLAQDTARRLMRLRRTLGSSGTSFVAVHFDGVEAVGALPGFNRRPLRRATPPRTTADTMLRSCPRA